MKIRNLVTFMLMFSVLFCSAEPQLDAWNAPDHPNLSLMFPKETAAFNPPFIHWKKSPEAYSYRVTLKGPEERVMESKWNFITPKKGLKQGKYTLSIEALDKSEKVIEKSRKNSFSIEKEAQELSFDLIVDKRNPDNLFIPTPYLDEIKATKDQRKEYIQRILEMADKEIPEALIDFEEPPVFPNGKFVWDDWLKCKRLCEKIDEYLTPLAFAYRLSGDKKYYEKAEPIIKKLIGWDPKGISSINNCDHAQWRLSHSLCLSFETYKPIMPEALRRQLIDHLKQRAEYVYAFLNPFLPKEAAIGLMNDPFNNHPWFNASSLGISAVTLLDEVPEAKKWASYATQLYYGAFLPRGGQSGGWHEGIDYMAYTVYFAFQISDILRNGTDIDMYKSPFLSKSAYYKIYNHPPVGIFAPIGDTQGRKPTGFDMVVMMRYASVYKEPVINKYVDTYTKPIDDKQLCSALLWDQRPKKPWYSFIKKQETSMPFAMHFKDIGWVTSNSSPFEEEDQIFFVMRSGKRYGHYFCHSHGDQNHFIVTAAGEKLIWDSGIYHHYLDDHYKNYLVQTKAHNAILIDGQGQNVFVPGADGKILEYTLEGEDLTVVGDASNPNIYPEKLKTFLRRIHYRNKKDFTVSDTIELNEPGIISWLLHSEFPIIWNPKEQTISIEGEKYKLEGTFDPKVPIEAVVTSGFPVPSVRKPDLIEYHIEFKTVDEIKSWKPILEFSISKR